MAENPLEEKILENAQSPKKASGDSGSAEAHSLPEQIEAARFLSSSRATKQGAGRGFRVSKMIPPGSV